MPPHIHSKPSLDLPQTNTSSNIPPTLQRTDLPIPQRRFLHADSKTSNSSRQSLLVAVIVFVVAVDDARDCKSEDFLQLFAHGLGGFAEAFALFSAVAAEDRAAEDFGFGDWVAGRRGVLVEGLEEDLFVAVFGVLVLNLLGALVV